MTKKGYKKSSCGDFEKIELRTEEAFKWYLNYINSMLYKNINFFTQDGEKFFKKELLNYKVNGSDLILYYYDQEKIIDFEIKLNRIKRIIDFNHRYLYIYLKSDILIILEKAGGKANNKK